MDLSHYVGTEMMHGFREHHYIYLKNSDS